MVNSSEYLSAVVIGHNKCGAKTVEIGKDW